MKVITQENSETNDCIKFHFKGYELSVNITFSTKEMFETFSNNRGIVVSLYSSIK